MKYKLFSILFAILILGPATMLRAQTPQEMMQKAATLYDEGDYSGAIHLYDSLLKQNLASEALYYNLANAYYKKEEYAKAILYYEKALLINPLNKDTRYNLSLAREHIVDKIEPLPRFFVVKWWLDFVALFSEKVWCIITLSLWLLCCTFLVLFFISRKEQWRKLGFYTAIGMLVFTTVAFSAGMQRYHQMKDSKSAIVMTPTVNIKASPNEQSNTLFVIHQGTKLKIIDHLKGWYNVKLESGMKGWIKEEDFARI